MIALALAKDLRMHRELDGRRPDLDVERRDVRPAEIREWLGVFRYRVPFGASLRTLLNEPRLTSQLLSIG